MRTLRALLFFCLVTSLATPLHGGLSAQSPARPATPSTAASRAAQPMDLNTASAAYLKTLPGIGDAYAKRIVDGRPYTAKNQLVTKGIIPQATYDKMKDGVVARRAGNGQALWK